MIQNGNISTAQEAINLDGIDSGLFIIELLDESNALMHREKILKLNK